MVQNGFCHGFDNVIAVRTGIASKLEQKSLYIAFGVEGKCISANKKADLACFVPFDRKLWCTYLL